MRLKEKKCLRLRDDFINVSVDTNSFIQTLKYYFKNVQQYVCQLFAAIISRRIENRNLDASEIEKTKKVPTKKNGQKFKETGTFFLLENSGYCSPERAVRNMQDGLVSNDEKCFRVNAT